MIKKDFNIFFIANKDRIERRIRKLMSKGCYSFTYRDVCHDLYLHLFTYAQKYPNKTVDDLTKILYKSIMSTFIRKYGKARLIIQNEETKDGILEIQTKSMEHAYEEGKAWSRVEDAINRLSIPHREVIEICCIQKVKYKVASELLGINIATLRTRVHRARKQLKKYIGNSNGYKK